MADELNWSPEAKALRIQEAEEFLATMGPNHSNHRL